MRICININVWQRPVVFAMTLEALRSQESSTELHILCGLSPDDPHLGLNEAACHRWGAVPLLVPNMPLSGKSNALTSASREFEWDYLMKMGSDDIVSPNFIDATVDRLRLPDGNSVGWGWADCYFYEPASQQLWYWGGYGSRRKESIGAGRSIRRDVLEQLDWQTHEQGIARNLDKSFTDRMRGIGVEIPYAHLPAGVYLVDCKDEHSLTSLADFPAKDVIPADIPASLGRYLCLLGS